MSTCSVPRPTPSTPKSPDDLDVPWHRVVNARGEVSARSFGDGAAEQRRRLEAEGVTFDANDRLPLADLLID